MRESGQKSSEVETIVSKENKKIVKEIKEKKVEQV